MEHDCKFEDRIIEMAADIKGLLSEFKAMNGSLRDTKKGFDEHQKESKLYRHQVSVLWSALHTIKWAIMLVFGSGLVWRVMEYVTK